MQDAFHDPAVPVHGPIAGWPRRRPKAGARGARSYIGAKNLYGIGINGQRLRVETYAGIDAADVRVRHPMESIRAFSGA